MYLRRIAMLLWVVLLALQPLQAQTSTPALPAASAVAPPAPTSLDDLRRDIASVLATATRIAQTQEDEGSLLLKVRDGFVTNLLWELFGFKNTEKTLVGQAISVIGILGVVLKAFWFLSHKGAVEPGWARGLTYAYLVLVVAVFSLLSFSGGVAGEMPASQSAARNLLDAGARMEAQVGVRLQALDARLAALSTAPPQAAAPSATPPAQDERTARTLSVLGEELKAVGASSRTAAEMSTTAAGRSTGWGWHLLICLLLLCVLAAQLLALHLQSRDR